MSATLDPAKPGVGSVLTLCIALGFALARPGSAQVTPTATHLFTLAGGASDSHFAFRISRAGDIDGDGHADVLVGAPLSNVSGQIQVGMVYVHSGADGRLLRKVSGDPSRDAFFGWPVRDAGDVDGDGTPDFVASARSAVVAVSGRTGSEIWRVTFGSATDAALGSLGDTDQDGHDDVLVSSPFETVVLSGNDGSVLLRRTGRLTAEAAGDCDGDGVGDIVLGDYAFAGTGRVQLLSGRDGSVLLTIMPPAGANEFGRYVAPAGDVDADGHADVIVGDTFGSSAMYVYSGQAGTLLRQVAGGSLPLAFPCRQAGDVDGDGFGDVILTRQWGLAVIVSGRTGAELVAYRKSPAGIFGLSIDGVGDVDRDGFDDVLIGDYVGGPAHTGSAHVLSGRSLPLTTDTHAVSIGSGGIQTLRLELGAAHAGEPFVFLGSASGVEPGISLGAVHLPLNPDAYTQVTGNLGLLFAPAIGALDGSGAGIGRLMWPPGLSVAGGTRLHHAALVFAVGFGRITTTSNAAPLLLQ